MTNVETLYIELLIGKTHNNIKAFLEIEFENEVVFVSKWIKLNKD